MSRVTVAGALHHDVIVTAPRLPRRDETLIGDSVRYDLGGKAGNQALAAARMGAPVTLVARLGSDAAGAAMRAVLAAAGIDLGQVQTDPGASGMSVAIVEAGGEYAAVVVSAANLALDPDAVDLPADTAVLCLSNEVPEAVNLALAARARDAGALVLLNAAPARPLPPDLRARAGLIVVNRVEAADLTGGAGPEAAADALAGAGAAIVTLGGDGLWLAEGGRTRHLPALPVTPVSSHGAGDAFTGALAARLAAGDSLAAAADMARAAAALHVATPVAGRAAITAADIAAFQPVMR